MLPAHGSDILEDFKVIAEAKFVLPWLGISLLSRQHPSTPNSNTLDLSIYFRYFLQYVHISVDTTSDIQLGMNFLLILPPKATNVILRCYRKSRILFFFFRCRFFFPIHLIKEWVLLSINLMVNKVQDNPKLQLTMKWPWIPFAQSKRLHLHCKCWMQIHCEDLPLTSIFRSVDTLFNDLVLASC